jgi:hypothetical protein
MQDVKLIQDSLMEFYYWYSIPKATSSYFDTD